MPTTIQGEVNSAATATPRSLTTQTATTDTVSNTDIYQYADQTNAANPYHAFAIHNYTDGESGIIDTVGSNVGLRIKQANNAAARPDKAAGYVGTGIFLDFQRAKPGGGGNLFSTVDRLAFVNADGNLAFYGVGGADWSGTQTTAPIQIGTYTGFLTRSLYMGYDYASNKAVIGALDSGASAFKPIQFSCSLAGSTTGFAVGGLTGPTWTSGTGTPEGAVTAPVGSIFSRRDGGAGTTLYVKESGTSNTGWKAVVTL